MIGHYCHLWDLYFSHKYIYIHRIVLVSQLCLTLCDPMNCSSPGSSVHGIFQARILEWVAIPFSRGSPQIPTLQAEPLQSEPSGKTFIGLYYM